MAIVINEFEVTESRPDVSDREASDRHVRPRAEATVATNELVDIAQRLAQLEERELRVEAN